MIRGDDQAPLAGLTVIDLTRFVSGPYCTMLLADAGADVIKIEAPGGDPSRHSDPVFGRGDHRIGAAFLRMNRRKRSVTLDLKSPAGREALERLVARADVLVENFSHGALARLGFDETKLHDLNPGLIYCSITGFGHSESDMRKRPAFNLIAEYEAGVHTRSDVDGTPKPLGPYVGDLFPGLHALSGLLMALYRRSITGCGARVDIAMFDSMLSLNEASASNETWLEDPSEGDLDSLFCPSGVFSSRDGFVCIDLVTDKQWQALCAIVQRPDLYAMQELSTGQLRSSNFDELLAAPLGAWLEQHDSVHIVELLSSNGVPAAAVRAPGAALTSRQSAQRGMVIGVGLDASVDMKVPASPIRINGRTSQPFVPVPAAGQHTEEVLRDIAGMTSEQIKQTQRIAP